MYIDKIPVIVNKYSNTNHRSIKMKPSVKPKTYVNVPVEFNTKHEHKCITKYKRIFS